MSSKSKIQSVAPRRNQKTNTSPPCPLLEAIHIKVATAKENPDIWAEVDKELLQSQPGLHELKYTAVQLAAKYGRGEVLCELLTREEFVKDIVVKNGRGETALHLAAKEGHLAIVEKLIQCCKPSSLKHFVNSKSHFCSCKLCPDHDAEGRPVEVPDDGICRSYKVCVSLKENVHRTALHYAAAGRHAKTVNYLLSIPEVDVGSTDYERNTALHLAIPRHGTNGVHSLDVLQEFLRAAPKVDLNAKGKLGDTPLHKAVRLENIDAVELLCKERRLLCTKRNDDEMTPLRLAWELQKMSPSPDTLEIVKNTLLDRSEVRRDEEKLKSERESLYMAVNAILVGGTLLASVTFSGILEMPTQPPSKHFEMLIEPMTSAAGSPVPAQETDYVERQWLYIRVIDLFRGSNNMCFFLAVITVILAIQVPITRRNKKIHTYIEEEVEHLRSRDILVSFCLTLSTFCVGVAFVTGGLAKIPVSESGWSFVLSRWVPNEFSLIFKSTMLTTDLSMGSILFLILIYTITMDYFFILRNQISKSFSLQSLLTLLFCLGLFVLLIVVVVLLVIGSGLFNHYADLP